MELTIEQLGLTKDDIAERVIERAVESLLGSQFADGGEGERYVTSLRTEVDAKMKATIGTRIDALFREHVEPKLADKMAGYTFQPTNRYGEPTRAPQTMTEYLADACDRYLSERVDWQGRSRDECLARHDSFTDSGRTRIAGLIHKHLESEIATRIQAALKDINAKIAGGIAETVKAQLEAALKRLRVEATV